MKETSSQPDVVKSAGRALAILEYFAEIRRPAAAREIAAKLEIPRSSANVLIRSLVNLGYLWFDDEHWTYFPTPKVVRLGGWLHEGFHIDPRYVRALHKLNEQTGETVTLSIQNGFEVQFIRVLHCKHPIGLNLAEGQKVSLFDSAVGLAILSCIDSGEIRELAATFNARKGLEGGIINEESLLDRVRGVRRAGVSIAYDKVLPDTGALAVGIRNGVVDKPLAFGVGGPTQRIRGNQRRLIEILKETVARLRA